MCNDEKTHEGNFQDDPDIKEVREENTTDDIDQAAYDRHEVEDTVSDEAGYCENREEDDQGVEGDADSVEISIGRPVLRRTRQYHNKHLNSFVKEFQY